MSRKPCGALFPQALATICMVLIMSHAIAADPAGAPPPPRDVRVVKVLAATAPLVVALPARTAPIEEARIYSRATGVVAERPVDIGDQVKQGDLLARIAAPEIDFKLAGARATVQQAEAKLTLARNELARARLLAPARAIAIETIDLRESKLLEAEAELAVANAALGQLDAVHGFQTITAPFAGSIAGRQIDRGDQVRGDQSQAGQWLFHLVRLDVLRLEVDATPELALRVSPGMKAEVTFPDIPGKTHGAEVRRRTNLIDASSGTMRLELVLPNADLGIPAGLAGNARFSVPPRAGTTLLPGNALISRQGQAAVLLVTDGKVHESPVVLGRNLGPVVEILSGLTPGQDAIISPNSLLKNGDPVNSTEAPPQGKGG